MIPDARLQTILEGKDHEAALEAIKQHPLDYSEGWAVIDGALVVYNIDDPPVWLKPVLEARDEEGFTPEGIRHATRLEAEVDDKLYPSDITAKVRDRETIGPSRRFGRSRNRVRHA